MQRWTFKSLPQPAERFPTQTADSKNKTTDQLVYVVLE